MSTGYILAPGTAMAKEVARTYHKKADRVPSILAAPTHSAKYAPMILKALRKEDVKDGPWNFESMFSSLESMGGQPSIHESLRRSVKDEVHGNEIYKNHVVIEKNIEEVYDQVKKIAKDW